MKKQLALLAFLVLASCATVGDLGGGGTADNPALSAVRQISSGLFNRGRGATPPQFTATRASLREAGITRPVLVARLDAVGISVGLLEFQTPRDAIVWRSLDGNTITTAGGLLRNTRGFGPDLHSLETAPLQRALSEGGPAEYSRLFRGLDGLDQIETRRLYCRLQPEGRETVDVLGRAYDTQRYREICRAQDRDEPIFENTYWQGRGGTIWQSRQWAGPDLGYIDLERVNN
ncbi:YjbF family lipoprotein [Aliiroseovarius sp.]|uniref:YjbF family lipoprotein n=1 Tax=Aliiroseovarius sp. TaxID=1872442 RepID=UPI002635A9FF|nr:YjbF family lipoprotein [Aliiroseovarius sp.]